MPFSQPQAVVLDHCTKRYGQVRAADDVSLEIRTGEFFTILGASGSGKTTCLRMIGGFERTDDGRVMVNGHDVTRLPAHRRDVHTVFQDYALFPHLSVRDNVGFALSLRGTARVEARRRVDEALGLVQLEGFADRRPAQLSGGQQQRVALARAVVDRPAVLLLDEPLSALDAKIRAELREQLKVLQRSIGITFVYVTHDQEEALTLSDRIAVMRGGKVLQCGTPIEVYEHPADLFVAEFIGRANFLTGTVTSADDRFARVNIDGWLVSGSTDGRSLATGAAVRVMVRPENLRLDPGADASEGRPGVIRTASYLGHATEYLIDSGPNTFRALELRRRGETPRSEGAAVTLSWSPDEALVYPAGSN